MEDLLLYSYLREDRSEFLIFRTFSQSGNYLVSDVSGLRVSLSQCVRGVPANRHSHGAVHVIRGG